MCSEDTSDKPNPKFTPKYLLSTLNFSAVTERGVETCRVLINSRSRAHDVDQWHVVIARDHTQKKINVVCLNKDYKKGDVSYILYAVPLGKPRRSAH